MASLVTTADPKHREIEAAKAKARAATRFRPVRQFALRCSGNCMGHVSARLRGRSREEPHCIPIRPGVRA